MKSATLVPGVAWGVVGGAAIAMPAWIAYLATTLPTTYTVLSWNLTWVGFDVVLFALLALTAVLGIRRHRLTSAAALGMAVMLLCDAWFDWTTSTGSDHLWATISALVVEVPLAITLILVSRSMSRQLPAVTRPV